MLLFEAVFSKKILRWRAGRRGKFDFSGRTGRDAGRWLLWWWLVGGVGGVGAVGGWECSDNQRLF